MQFKINVILKRYFNSMLEQLAFFPLVLAVSLYTVSENDICIFIAALTFSYIIGMVTRTMTKRGKRMHIIAIGLLLSFIIGYLFTHKITQTCISGIIIFTSFLRGIRYMEASFDDIFPTNIIWIGMFVYIGAYFVYRYIGILTPYFNITTIIGFIYIVAAFLVVNSRQLQAANLSNTNQNIPVKIKTNNRLLIIITLCIITVIAAFDAIKAAFGWIARKIIYVVLKIMEILSSILKSEGISEGGQKPGLPDIAPGQYKPSVFEHIVEIVMRIVFICVILAASYFAIKKIFQWIKKFILWIRQALASREIYSENAAYIDQKESLVSMRDFGRDYAKKLKDWASRLLERQKKWADLKTNRERIHYLYRRLILKCITSGYKCKIHMTPDQRADDIFMWDEKYGATAKEITPLYNRARYAESDISDEEVDKISSQDTWKFIANR